MGRSKGSGGSSAAKGGKAGAGAPPALGFDLGDNLFADVWQRFLAALGTNPELMAEISKRHGELFASLSLQPEQDAGNGAQAPAGAAKGKGKGKGKGNSKDRRFAHPDWESNPFYKYLKESYRLNSELLERAADSVDFSPRDRQALDFLLTQLKSAMSPANFPLTNPEVAAATIESKGENLRRGMENYMGDLEEGAITLSDPAAFAVGENLATTPGKVIAQNHLYQLIEYAPTTAKVHERPLLIVPPCINKYYILDLAERDSFVAHLVAAGFRVFLVSWVNAGSDQAELDWDDYVAGGVLEAIESVRQVSGQARINTLGYCIGGTLLACAQAVLGAGADRQIENLSLLTAFIDFCDTGDIGLFVDERFVAEMERRYADGGLFPGASLKATFAYMRPDDLVWPYVVSNYMLGKTPPPFNILHWNSDSTNLPGRMYAWYLRNTYLENRLKDGVELCGAKVKVAELGVPGMVVACERDHIVPWEAAYASARLLGAGQASFVLAASGHVAGIVNPPAKHKGHHFVARALRRASAKGKGKGKSAGAKAPAAALPAAASDWLAQAKKNEGSWWDSYCSYLKGYSGALVAAPKRPGDMRHRPLADAPGSYVTAPLPEAG